jgi:hypothetical protein
MAAPVNIDISATGRMSGTPLTSGGVTVPAGVEQVVTFTNWNDGVNRTIVLTTDQSDVTYGYASGETGGRIHLGVDSYIETFGGRNLYLNSTTEATVWIRIL